MSISINCYTKKMDLVCNYRFKSVFLNCYFEKKWTRPIWEKVSVIKPSAFCWLPLLKSLVRGCAHKLPAAESHNQCRSTPRHSLRTKPRIFHQRWRALRESMRWKSCVSALQPLERRCVPSIFKVEPELGLHSTKTWSCTNTV